MTPLEQKIIQANRAYWVDHQPIISDAEYDQLIEQLRKEDPYNTLLTTIDDGMKNTCVHPYPMLSLRKVYQQEDLKSWICSVSRSLSEQFLIQLKLDGCTCRVTDGKIYTRGDGHAGEDITAILPIIKGITQDNDLGEIVITNSDFTRYFTSGKIVCKDGSLYQNQRNAVAGLLGRIGDLTNIPKVLTFVSYDHTCPTQQHVASQSESLKIEDLMKWALSFDYPIDGQVFKLTDPVYADSLGNTAHHPRGQIAFKFENCSKETEITDITWQLGRTGVLTPVVKIKEIEIHGSHITSVTAHDAKHVLDMDICIGHKVKISRSGDVIPFIESVWPTPQTKDIHAILPEVCPICGKRLSWTATHVDLVCTNEKCADKLLKGLIYSCKVLSMDGWAEETQKELILKVPMNLLYVFQMSQDTQQDVFPGKRSINLFHVKEDMLKRLTPDLLLTAQGIPLVGKENSKEILTYMTLEDLADQKLDILPYSQIKTNIQIWCMKKENPIMLRMILDYLNDRGISFTKIEKIRQGTVCFTGAVENMSRNQLRQEAEKRGYKPVDSVNHTLSILVVADPNSTSTKMRKATSLGIKVMSPSEFLALPQQK